MGPFATDRPQAPTLMQVLQHQLPKPRSAWRVRAERRKRSPSPKAKSPMKHIAPHPRQDAKNAPKAAAAIRTKRYQRRILRRNCNLCIVSQNLSPLTLNVERQEFPDSVSPHRREHHAGEGEFKDNTATSMWGFAAETASPCTHAAYAQLQG